MKTITLSKRGYRYVQRLTWPERFYLAVQQLLNPMPTLAFG